MIHDMMVERRDWQDWRDWPPNCGVYTATRGLGTQATGGPPCLHDGVSLVSLALAFLAALEHGLPQPTLRHLDNMVEAARRIGRVAVEVGHTERVHALRVRDRPDCDRRCIAAH